MLQAVPARGKRRNVEKRREKSRCAARSRREKEAGIFTDLYVTVPIVSESTITHVDRIAVLRLAATLCRVRRVVEKVLPVPITIDRNEPNELFAEASVNESLDGFLMMIDSSGLIIYISPNCSRSLGLTQTDLIGQNLHDYLHADDSASLASGLDVAAFKRVHTLLRMKSVLSPRGRNLTLKSAVYKPVSFAVSKTVVDFPPIQPRRASSPRRSPTDESHASFARADGSDFEDDDDGNDSPDNTPVTQLDSTYFVMHGLPLAHCGAGAMGDYHGPGTFMTRHTMDMKFSYCHERLSDYLGYDSKSLMNSSFFSLVHPEDLPSLTASLKELYRKGHINTGYYRLMVKSGGYVWITTTGNTVTHSTRGHGGQYIVCIHQLISCEEDQDITADVQQTSPSLLSKLETERKNKHAKVVGPSTEQLLQRAPIVNDYIPLTNPNALSINALGGLAVGGSVMSKTYGQSGSSCHQDWLFRAVGGIETQRADARKRGNGERSNAAVRTVGQRAHVDVAARNHAIVGPTKTNVANVYNAPTNSSLLLPSAVPLDSITQADLERVLFAPMPPTGVHTSPAGSGVAVSGQTRTNEQYPTDDLSSLAPFIHQTDEILSLDFGQTDDGVERLSPILIDGLDSDFDSVTDHNHGAVYMLDTAPRSERSDRPVSDPIADKVKIESIYRYLRDDEDDFHSGPGGAAMEPLPPLLIVDHNGDQKCPSLMSPWQYQMPTPPYTRPQAHIVSPGEQYLPSMGPESETGYTRNDAQTCHLYVSAMR